MFSQSLTLYTIMTGDKKKQLIVIFVTDYGSMRVDGIWLYSPLNY